MTLVLMLQVLAVFLMFLPGVILRRLGRLTEAGTGEMARLLVLTTYPCLIFCSVLGNYTFKEILAAWPLPLCMFCFFFFAYGVSLVVKSRLRFTSDGQMRLFLFQGSINNYSFLPMPIILLLYGERGVVALMLSALGAEIAVWTLGMYILNGHQLSWRSSLRSLLNPPLAALVLALLTAAVRDCTPAGAALSQFLSSDYGTLVMKVLKTFGGMTIPLAVTVAGSSLAMLGLKELRSPQVWWCSVLRLVFVPVLALLILHVLPLPQEYRQILNIVVVMPVALSSITFSKLYAGDDHFTAGTILLSHLLGLITIPILLGMVL